MTLHELNEKDVIQVKTGENLGRIDDIVFEGQQITQVILRGRSRMFGMLGRDDDLFIPWTAVKTIGADVVMVDVEIPPPRPARSHRGWV
ncbi:YlmC/YmxH family sporulation protein [bacterium]|uniref:YlmC/YmxH family sporulation protein n=1 Tax=Gemmiger sp. TaxID=2049027 RepID=UPI002A83137B|nr:YlmC/YmxH family sporulation protein [Gemmiger sp.]MCI6083054.1 YlmC/YmxH family sporulation protein [bacterium]MCI7192807.1 YlmC/YmxH family sporulation protein [bacterium]MCI7744687.1 YlmC/YmxH family sporulation protein [bacterium]MCI7794100.1 YlmC/YmxH family sporulation protein [bacterium]MDD6717383.1 YlmC/YmxH family sporulation protein [bacterium]